MHFQRRGDNSIKIVYLPSKKKISEGKGFHLEQIISF